MKREDLLTMGPFPPQVDNDIYSWATEDGFTVEYNFMGDIVGTTLCAPGAVSLYHETVEEWENKHDVAADLARLEGTE